VPGKPGNIEDLSNPDTPRKIESLQAPFLAAAELCPKSCAPFRRVFQPERRVMSFERANSRPRAKRFTDGRQDPVDRNDRARLMHMAEASRRRGNVTRAAVDILRALLYQFANLKDGRIIPSHQRLGEAAGCCARTCGRCLTDLEQCGLVAWVHRIRRVVERVQGVLVRRVVRTSNAYSFPPLAKNPGKPADGHFGRGTENQPLPSVFVASVSRETDPSSDLGAALLRYQVARGRRMQPA
jgi:hypothetical protein